MGMNPFSPYPHYAWFAHGFSVSPPRVFSVHQRRSVTHRIVLTTEGHAEIRIAAAGTETAFHTEKGDFGFFPLDHDGHTNSIETSAMFRACELLIRGPHIRPVRIVDVVEPGSAFPPVPVFRAVVLRACVLWLSPMGGGQRVSEGVGDEVADSTTPLSRIALDLGFSSQSHFTRLFSSHTGFTPRQFRQLHGTPAR